MALERDVHKLALRFFQALDTPRSLTCAILTRYGEWAQLCDLKMEPALFREDVYFSSLDRFRRDSAATAFLRKLRGLETGVDLKKAAMDTFFLCENQCYNQNLFLNDWFHLGGNGITTPQGAPASVLLLSKILNKARKWVGKTLGGLPESLNGKFGPGATFESAEYNRKVVGLGLTAYDKLHHQPTGTLGLSSELEDHLVWQTAMGEVWGPVLSNRVVPRVRGNRFTSVPKDATKNRGICIEPGLNVFGQLALGAIIRNRLSRRGLHLKPYIDQKTGEQRSAGQDLHCRMAAEASRTGSHATLDLSNASDTICSALVKLLLPEDWFHLLSELRSPWTEIAKGKWVKLEKFSSMGNGYTFELETLVFASLLHAVGARIGYDSWVYGDDMIVPTEIAKSAERILRLSGFTPNPKKSFSSGPFRESCGGDFWRGEDVRPYFLEESPCNAQDWIVLHNRIRDLAISFKMPELLPIARSCIDAIPQSVKLYGPEGLGDVVLHSSNINDWTIRIRDGIREVRGWVPFPRRKSLRRYPSRVALAAAILGLPSRGLSPRDSVGGHGFCWLAYS